MLVVFLGEGFKRFLLPGFAEIHSFFSSKMG